MFGTAQALKTDPPQLTVVDQYEKTSLQASRGNESLYLKQAGIDDITLNVRVRDAASKSMLDAWRMGRGRLGSLGQAGFQDLWAPHTAFWYPKTETLSLEVKRDRKRVLVAAGEVRACAQTVVGVLVDAGILRPGDRPYATGEMTCSRIDVAVDVVMPTAQRGQELLRALELMTEWSGLYVDGYGRPGERTVYHKRPRQKGQDRVVGRVYSRHREEPGEAAGRVVRFEREQRYKPSIPARALTESVVTGLWLQHFVEMAPRRGKVKIGERRRVDMQLAEMVRNGEITYRQAEQASAFLAFEQLGLLGDTYPERVVKDRRRLVRKLGVGVKDLGTEDVEVDVGEVIALGIPSEAWSRGS